MPIIGFNFTKTSIERIKSISKIENITTILKIIDVKKEKTKDASFLKLFFEFQVKYGDIGEAVLAGNVLYTDEEIKLDTILKEYSLSKDLAGHIKAIIYNSIFYKSNIKLLILAEDVGLPPHFQIPSVKLQK